MSENHKGQPSFHDDLARLDEAENPEPLLSMLRGMWAGGQAEKETRYRRHFEKLALCPGGSCLEIGCAAGGASRFLARMTRGEVGLVGSDPSALIIADAKRLTPEDDPTYRQLSFEVRDGGRLGYPSASFDAAFCARVLVHAENPERIIDEMVRVVRPGGRLLFIEPDRDAVFSTLPHGDIDRLYWKHRKSLNPTIGRELYPRLLALGLTEIESLPEPRIATSPPGLSLASEVRRDVERKSGDYWLLVEAGLTTADALLAYSEEIEAASRSGLFYRYDIEIVTSARLP